MACCSEADTPACVKAWARDCLGTSSKARLISRPNMRPPSLSLVLIRAQCWATRLMAPSTAFRPSLGSRHTAALHSKTLLLLPGLGFWSMGEDLTTGVLQPKGPKVTAPTTSFTRLRKKGEGAVRGFRWESVAHARAAFRTCVQYLVMASKSSSQTSAGKLVVGTAFPLRNPWIAHRISASLNARGSARAGSRKSSSRAKAPEK